MKKTICALMALLLAVGGMASAAGAIATFAPYSGVCEDAMMNRPSPKPTPVLAAKETAVPAIRPTAATVTPAATPAPVQEGVVEIVGPVSSAQVTMEPPVDATVEPTAVPRLHGLIIGIDPGHQARSNSEREPIGPDTSEKKAKVSSGTSGKSTGIDEYVTNLEVGLKLRDALEALGCTVHMTREVNEIDISNMERALMMNELGADLVLRLHCDGSENSSANGIGMFVRETGPMQAESYAAAEILLETMCEATGAKARSVYTRDTYTMNNWSTVPCILVEMGFMSNREEDEKLNDPAYQDLLVQGMVEGICRYFER